jgi:hypothetical protein
VARQITKELLGQCPLSLKGYIDLLKQQGLVEEAEDDEPQT